MPGVSVSIDGLIETENLLSQMLGRGNNLTPAFRRIDQSVTLFFQRQFDRIGTPGGHKWPPISETTALGRMRWSNSKDATVPKELGSKPGRARAGMWAILRDTNRLWASYVKGAGPESIRVFRPWMYERGSSVPYAASHQKERRTKTGRPIPARIVVPDPMPRLYVSSWETVIARYVSTGHLSNLPGT